MGKSNVLLFRGRNQTLPPINLTINDLPVTEKDNAKYLGIMIDNKLTFSKHIEHVKSKLIRGNAILGITRQYLPKSILLNTYHAHIQPHIDYGQNIWGHAAQTHLDDIIRQQEKSIRIINFKKKDDDVKPLFKQSKILPVRCSGKFNSGKLLWKINNSICPSLNHLFAKRQQPVNTFHVPYKRLDVSQNSVTYESVKVWNSIPPPIRASNSINIFKSKYKEYLLSRL